MDPPPGDPFANGDELGDIVDDHDDWTECTQAGSGRTYYYNFDTEESQWELPVTTTLSIECPEGCGPGDMLSIEVDGETLEIAVPDGVGPGEAFEVHIGEAEPEDEGVGEEEPPPPRDFVLLVLANAHVPVQKKLKLSASTLDMLCEQVAAAVGVADAVLCSPSDAAADECMFTALEELEDKAKVMVWPATAFGEEEGEAVAAAALEEREFILMVQANEHVATNKKVKLAASTLESLAAQVADKVAMCGEVALTRPTASPAQGDFFQDLGEVDGKAKISVWPASKLRDLSAAADAAAEAAAAAEQAAAAPAPVREEADDGKPPPDPFAADDEIGDTINDTDWAECTQNSTGRVYYYNFSSEESTWEVPGLENEGDGHLQRDPEPEPEQPEQPEQHLEHHPEEDDDETDDRYDAEQQEMPEEAEREAKKQTETRRRQAARTQSAPSGQSLGAPFRGHGPTPRRRRQHTERGTPRSADRRARRSTSRPEDSPGGRSKKTVTPKKKAGKYTGDLGTVIVRGPAFDSSSTSQARPSIRYLPISQDRYLPEAHRKRIAQKQQEIEEAKRNELELAVERRYARLGGGYDDDEYYEWSDDDDYSDYSQDGEVEEGTPEQGGDNITSYMIQKGAANDDDDEERSPARSPQQRGQRRGGGAGGGAGRTSSSLPPLAGSIALQHRVSVRPSDCDTYGELSAGSGVQFCADAMAVWTLKSTGGTGMGGNASWRAVVGSAETHWVRRVQTGEEVVMTVDVRRWAGSSFDANFVARVDGTEVFATTCRFDGLAPAKHAWAPAKPPSAFKKMWSE